jgi:excisionase family DNA binding protein
MQIEVDTTKYLHSVAEAAELLSLSRNTVYSLIKSGRLLAVYPTSKARISTEALKRFVVQLEREQRSLTNQLSQGLR